jgi:hypothetical protein
MFFRIIGRRERRNQAPIASHSIFKVRQPAPAARPAVAI